ncbi:hypothetical protein [Dactylosporangium aurantiacum]|uniref:hypothetical protein n=1 Tax=Dactylosporangium aurantiacum TaxID=35754 RepID=UPI00247FD43A|nr:hypothetical protein [Dactylosporangium aurantiacum]
MKPLPGGTVSCAVANVPYAAATLATVGSGPRWYGLSARVLAASADGIITAATATATTPTTPAVNAVTRDDLLRRVPPRRVEGSAGTFVSPFRSSMNPFVSADTLPHVRPEQDFSEMFRFRISTTKSNGSG